MNKLSTETKIIETAEEVEEQTIRQRKKITFINLKKELSEFAKLKNEKAITINTNLLKPVSKHLI